MERNAQHKPGEDRMSSRLPSLFDKTVEELHKWIDQGWGFRSSVNGPSVLVERFE